MGNDELKKLLQDEAGGLGMSDGLFERFIGTMTEFRLKNKEMLIPYGKLDTNVYVQKSGIMRALYFDGENEKTYGFSLPGTVTLSYHSHFMRQPSFFQFESCGESDMMKMSKKDFDTLLAEEHEFALWVVAIQSAQLYLNEFKHSAIIGSARERDLLMIKKRPEILARVPLKIIASYLGVTPTYLSYLRKISME